MRSLHCSVVALLILAASACSTAPDAAQDGTDFEFETSSGLTVRMIVHEGSGLFASNVFVGAGSTRETESTAGSSHFLEHLLFNGTSTMTQEDIYAATDRIGAYNNATTKREFTHYMMVAPQEELGAALGIQSAMLLDSVLPEDKFEKERGIILEEMSRDADDPGSAREDRLRELLEADDPAYRRPVLGTPESIATLSREDVLEYYRAQYVPANMKLLLMGDFDPTQARALIEELFSSDREARPQPAPMARALKENTWSVDGGPDELVSVVVRIPAPGVGHPDFAAMDLIADALGGGESGRIPMAFDRDDSLSIQGTSVSLRHRHGQSLLEIRAEAAPGTDADAIASVILGELATVARTGLRAVEWTQARNRLLTRSIRQIEQLHYYALLQGELIWHAEAGFESRYQAALADSYDSIAQVARTWFESPAVEVAILEPGATGGRREFDPAAAGYVAREDAEIGRPLPGSGKLEGHVPSVRQVQPPTVTTLENGMTLIHAASPGTRMFAIHVLVRDRSAREPVEHPGMADLLHRVLPAGAGNYDREELAALLDGIGADWKVTDSGFIPYDDYYATDPRFSFLRLDCVDLYWKEAMRLAGLMLSDPTLPQEEIDRARGELMQRVRQDQESGSARARAEFATALYGPGDPRSRPVFGREGSLDGIDTRALKAFALDYLDPGQLIVSIVGGIDRQAVLRQAGLVLSAGAASDKAGATVGPPRLTDEDSRIQLDLGESQADLRTGRIFEFDPADRWPLEVAAMVASDRMQQDLRETRGWAYSLGIDLRIEDDRALLSARIGTRPELSGPAEAALGDWLGADLEDVSADEIAAAVNSHLGRMRMRRVTSVGRAFNLGHEWFSERSIDAAAELGRGLRAVTPEDVIRVSERYFTDAPRVTVVVE